MTDKEIDMLSRIAYEVKGVIVAILLFWLITVLFSYRLTTSDWASFFSGYIPIRIVMFIRETRAAQLRDEAVRELADTEHKNLSTEDCVGTAVQTCPFCAGKGGRKTHDWVWKVCTKCNGSGHV